MCNIETDKAQAYKNILPLILIKSLFESSLFMILSIEILDCLEVKKSISSFLVVVLVSLGHFGEGASSSLGHEVGYSNIKENQTKLEHCELPSK